MLLVATALLTVFCDRKTLTTHQGHPVADNQSLRSVGERRPATLENYQFIEKIFGRERIAERVVHARGTGAHGWFESFGKIGEEPASKFTRAKVLTQTGRARRWHQFLGRARTFSYSDTQRYRVGIVLQ